MKKKIFTTLTLLMGFTGLANAQFKSPVKFDSKALVTIPRQSFSSDSLFPGKAPLSQDSIKVLAGKRAASAKHLSAGADLSTNLIIDDGTRIRGIVGMWSGGPFLGVSDLRPVNGTYPESIAPNAGIPSLCVTDGKHYYAFDYSAGGGQVVSVTYYVYDANTWKLEKQVSRTANWTNVPQMMAYNPHDGKIWAVSYDALKGPVISQLDTETGAFNWVSQQYFLGFLQCMAFKADGTLYGINSNGELVTVDLNTLTTNTPIATVAKSGLGYYNDIIYNDHTDKLYWFNLDGNFQSCLYEIDPQTGQTSLVSQLPGYFTYALKQMRLPDVSADAPNTVAALSVDFGTLGSTKGTINMTAPTTTYGGSILSGTLTMSLYVDSVLVKSETQQPGASISVSHDFKTEGDHYVQVVYTGTSGNNSPRGTIIAYCGKDTPATVENLLMTTDDQTGKTHLSWDAVGTGIHGGYVKTDDVTYTITRQPDNVVVADHQSGTTFDEVLPETLARYSYTVQAQSNGMQGEAVESNSIVWGKSLETPYKVALGSDEFGNWCTTQNLDGHGDGFYPGWGVFFVNGGYSADAFDNDKWLYTPAFHLKKGTYYYRLQHQGSPFTLTYGKYRTPENQMQHVIGTIDQDQTADDYLTTDDNSDNQGGYSSYITYKKIISIEEEGDYYFGVNYTRSQAGGEYDFSTKLKNFEVKEGPAFTAPTENVIDSVKTFAKGELKNNIWFTTPTKDYNGNTLTAIDSVEVYLLADTTVAGRKTTYNKLVRTVRNLRPGTQYSTDAVAAQGNNIYYLYAYNASGIGGESECFVWSGIDYPDVVQNPQYKVTDNLNTTLTWDAPSELGLNGGYVDPSKITYNAGQAAGAAYGLVTVSGGSGLTERTFTYNEMVSTQQMFYYGVTPVSELGEGRGLMIGIVLGTPYTAPFKESFNYDTGSLATAYWARIHLLGQQSWNVVRSSTYDTNVKPYDNDGGLWVFEHAGEELSADLIQTPIFSLQGVKNPVLSFWFYHNPEVVDRTAGISIFPVDNDVIAKESIASIGLNNGETTRGWKHYEIPLTQYVGTNRLYFYIQGSNTQEKAVLALDNFEIYDNINTDLAIESFSAPAKVNANEENVFKVDVRNMGRDALADYAVGLYADGELQAESAGTSLAFGKTATLTFNVVPSPKFYGKQVKFEAKVLVDGDENELNDLMADTVYVSSTLLPVPQNLTAQESGDQTRLSWEAPAMPEYGAVVEGFEDYEPFIIDNIGDWTNVDKDGMLSTAPVASNSVGTAVDFPNNSGAKAFQVWTTEGLQYLPNTTLWRPRVGKKCLIDFAASTMSASYVYNAEATNDDWFISPRVVGGTEVSMWVHEVKSSTSDPDEEFEFAVSYATTEATDFEVQEHVTVTATGSSWTKLTFTLPEDTKYFAIHSVSKQTFALMIDNITYTPGYSDITLLGYNVYCDGNKLNDKPVEKLQLLTDRQAEQEYGVTAVFEEGESDMVRVQVTSGIGANTLAGVQVYACENGLCVENAAGKVVTLYNATGQTVARRTLTSNHAQFAATPGAYVVSVGSDSYKIAVR